MADLPTGFWAGWIAVITIVTLVGLAWLVWSVYFSANGAAAEDVWDETLREGTAPVEARADVMQDAPPPEAVEALEETEGRAAGTTVEEPS